MVKLFGTNGIRGLANIEITPEFAAKFGVALGSWLGENSTIVMGRDCRTAARMIKRAFTTGLMSCGIHITDLRVTPVPVVQYLVSEFHADAGACITASHNPPQYIGLKIFDSTGIEVSPSEEEEIEEIFFNEKFTRADWRELGDVVFVPSAGERYIREVVKLFDEFDEKTKIVIDCASGPVANVAPQFFTALKVDVVSVNTQQSELYPFTLPEPSVKSLESLAKIVLDVKGDLGIAYDSDGDRFYAVDELGNLVSGDTLLLLFAKIALENKRGKIVAPIVATSQLDKIAKEYGGKVVRTPVGSIVVERAILKEKAVFGGEGNGGYIFPDFKPWRDGIYSAAILLDYLRKKEKTFSEVLEELPKVNLVKDSIFCPKRKIPEVMENIEKKIGKGKVEGFGKGDVDRTDGIKIIFSDDEWFAIRPAGTEPAIRVYAESKTIKKAEKMLNFCIKLVKEYI